MEETTKAVCACGHHNTRHVGQEADRPFLHCIDCPCPASTAAGPARPAHDAPTDEDA